MRFGLVDFWEVRMPIWPKVHQDVVLAYVLGYREYRRH